MKKRIEYIDIVRGICILYMIAGHIDFRCVAFDHYIHAFHMPLFFLFSGFFFKKPDHLLDYSKKLFKKVIIPYLIWAIIFIVIDRYTFLGTGFGLKKGFIMMLTNNNDNLPIAGALWFLTAFFICNILFAGIQSKINNKVIKIGILFLCMIIGIYGYQITKINLWWSLYAALTGIGLMEIGYIAREKEWIEKTKIKNWIGVLGVTIVNTVLIMITGYVNMRTNVYPNLLMFLINIVLSAIVYINIALLLEKIPTIAKTIKLLGKESIIPLCLNQFVILVFNKLILINLLNCLGESYRMVGNIIVLGFSVTTIILLTKFLSQSRLKILFGK